MGPIKLGFFDCGETEIGKGDGREEKKKRQIQRDGREQGRNIRRGTVRCTARDREETHRDRQRHENTRETGTHKWRQRGETGERDTQTGRQNETEMGKDNEHKCIKRHSRKNRKGKET